MKPFFTNKPYPAGIRKKLALIGMIAILLGTFIQNDAQAYSPVAYPGAIWNRTAFDFNNVEGFGEQGNLAQGVQWLTLPGDIAFTTFLQYRWRVRTLNQTYYDSHGPTIGVDFAKGIFHFGLQHERQYYPGLSERLEYPSLYLTWYETFKPFGDKFPGRTWGRAIDDFHNYEGFGVMGFVAQAVNLYKVSDEINFRAQILYSWRFRTLNDVYYNYHGPAVGVEFAHSRASLGAAYAWDYYTTSKSVFNNLHVYLDFYFDWDLKKL
jgi:hypothetical protein